MSDDATGGRDKTAAMNRGRAHHSAGRLTEAEENYRQVLAAEPNHPEALYLLGGAALQQGNHARAAELIGRAIAAAPGVSEYHIDHGIALSAKGRRKDAVAAYNKALNLRPDYAKANNNLGAVLQDQGKLRDAVAVYRRVVALDPDDAEAHNNLAGALKDQGRLEEAVPTFRRAIAVDPAFDEAHSNLIMALAYDPRTTAGELAAEHQAWAARHERPLAAPPDFPAGDDPERRLRIALVSADFYSHPEGFFMEPMLAHHDRASFEMLCYANTTRSDAVTARLKGHADGWRDIAGLSDRAFAERVRRDRIDILLELTGHQAHNRLLALVRRPAPLQVAWLSAVNGRGMASLDYLITDRIHAPAGDDALYVEQLTRMPDGYACYRPPDYAPAVSELPALRQEHVTFGCFNNFAKTNDRVIALWAKILHAVPDAHLLMKAAALDDRMSRELLHGKFEAAGVSRQRIELQGRAPHAELLSGYGEVDIALDPFPYSGGLTTCEALWMGVPVITWPGGFAQGRHCASHLTQVGLGEFIANSAEAYAALASRWAEDISALSELRAGLRARMAGSTLCDGAKFTAAFERELRRIWRRYCEAGSPGHDP